jgi:hypothetical protein
MTREISKGDPGAQGFRQITFPRRAGIMDKAYAGCFGGIGEMD